MILNLFIKFIIIVVTIVSCRAAFNSNKQSSCESLEITETRYWNYVQNEIVILPTGESISLAELINRNKKHVDKLNGDDECEYNHKYIKDNFFRTASVTRVLKYIGLVSEYAYRLKNSKSSDVEGYESILRITIRTADECIKKFRTEYFWENETDLETMINNLTKGRFRSDIIEHTRNHIYDVLKEVLQYQHIKSFSSSRQRNLDNNMKKDLYQTLMNESFSTSDVFDSEIIRNDQHYDLHMSIDNIRQCMLNECNN
ncbi:uncharacterized protein LOC126893673 [Daktulosphaira vitifoliae]|uniref:uncharacterized protein LOC126893673 n=1 Tax=Daktulosphaira vitifoliae TaxID=58002 RepID=UPI0021AB037B|nr:uncharacterized protein LOC126893673 [Daktulosphaira vitifoliae]